MWLDSDMSYVKLECSLAIVLLEADVLVTFQLPSSVIVQYSYSGLALVLVNTLGNKALGTISITVKSVSDQSIAALYYILLMKTTAK